jgi:AraC family transcriptional regulator
MHDSGESEFDRMVFDSGLVRVGAFRCHPSHPSFHNSGPPRNCCFVFPRTAVEIQHEHERAFAANPNVVTFYNKGQAYLRNAISSEGDRCDWFGVQIDSVQDVVRAFDPSVDAHSESPFRFTRGWADADTYLLQRRVFESVVRGAAEEPLAIEELVVHLLERVVRSAYGTATPNQQRAIGPKQRDIVHHMEHVLSQRWGARLTLRDIASEVGLSAYHLCRLFRRATGTTLHQYRQRLHIRGSLESVIEADRPLVDIALEAGFSSHSHFTSSFREEFGQAPSAVRARKRIDGTVRQRAIF